MQKAFARDAQASVLCAYFADIARIEGLTQLAQMLVELSELLRVDAGGHLDFLMRAGDPMSGAPVGGSTDNLAALVQSWSEVAEHTLPEMARTARAEGLLDLASWCDSVRWARAEQLGRLRAALDAPAASPGEPRP